MYPGFINPYRFQPLEHDAFQSIEHAPAPRVGASVERPWYEKLNPFSGNVRQTPPPVNHVPFKAAPGPGRAVPPANVPSARPGVWAPFVDKRSKADRDAAVRGSGDASNNAGHQVFKVGSGRETKYVEDQHLKLVAWKKEAERQGVSWERFKMDKERSDALRSSHSSTLR